MVSDRIRIKVETTSNQIAQQNPFFSRARSGFLTKEEVISYLHNMKYVFAENLELIRLAAVRSQERGFLGLHNFYTHKILEEYGHDQWAKSDLKAQGVEDSLIETTAITPSIRRLFPYLRELIEHDPRIFLSYLAFAEYFTVLVAPEFLANLETKCKIPAHSLTAVSKHEQADQGHAHENFKMIEETLSEPTLESALEQPILEAIDRFSTLIHESLTECTIIH